MPKPGIDEVLANTRAVLDYGRARMRKPDAVEFKRLLFKLMEESEEAIRLDERSSIASKIWARAPALPQGGLGVSDGVATYRAALAAAANLAIDEEGVSFEAKDRPPTKEEIEAHDGPWVWRPAGIPHQHPFAVHLWVEDDEIVYGRVSIVGKETTYGSELKGVWRPVDRYLNARPWPFPEEGKE